MSLRFNHAAIGFIAAGAVALSTSADAAPMSLRGLAEQQVHIATIGYRLGAANANRCDRPHMLTGMLLHDLSQYDPGLRMAVSQAFSLGSGFGIIQIVPGSVAEQAGLHIDDEILAVRGISVEDPTAVSRSGKSYRRMEGFTAYLQKALQSGPTDLLVRRKGAVMRLSLQGQPGCGGEITLINSNEQNAWSDGNRVAITSAMTRLARSDDEIAFVVAHEMSHNMLGHSRSSAAQIFGARRSEINADQMAVGLMTYAGYQPQSGVSFLETARRRFWWSGLSLDHPGFGSRIKAVTAAIAVLPPTEWQVAASARPSPTAAVTAASAVSTAVVVAPPSYTPASRAIALASFSD